MVRLLSSKPPYAPPVAFKARKVPFLWQAVEKLCPRWGCRRLDHIVQRAQPRAWRVDQHCHVARRMPVGSHQFVRVRDSRPGEYFAHAGIDAAVEHELVGRRGLLEVGEMRALYALLPHPHIARVEGDVVARGAGAEHHHATALHDQTGDWERRLAGMLEHDIDVPLAGDVPDRLAELARLLDPGIVVRRADLRHLAPTGKLLAVDRALGAQLHHVVALAFIRDDADGVGAGSGRKLHAENAEAAGGAPHQYVVAWLQGVRRMAIEHAIGGGEGERVAGRLLPSQVRRFRHELTRLHAAELRE